MASEQAGTGAADLLDSARAGPAAIRGSTWRIAGYLIGLVVGVVSSALMFRHLGLRDTGRYGVATNLIAIVAGLADLGLTAIGVRELSIRDAEGRNRMSRSLLGLRIVTSITGVLGVAAFAYAVGYGGTLVLGITLAGFGLLLQSCQSTLTISLIADLRLAWVAAFDLLRVLLLSVLIIVLVALGAPLIAFLALSIPVGLVVLALNARIVWRRISVRPAFHPGEWRVLLGGALPYTLATAAGTLYTQVAVIVVSLISGADALGDFTLSSRAIQLLLVLPGLAVGTALPVFARAARDDRARLAYALGRTFEVSLVLGVWVALSLAVGARIAITVYGRQFSHAVPLLAIQGAGLGASFLGAVWANALLSLGRYRTILVINVLALFAGTGVVALLTWLDGARGAAIATAGWEVVVVLLGGAALARIDRRLVSSLRAVPRVTAAAGLGAATTLLALPVLASVALAGVVYLAAVVALGAVPAEVWHELRRVVPTRR